jgi:hypothetical protein
MIYIGTLVLVHRVCARSARIRVTLPPALERLTAS